MSDLVRPQTQLTRAGARAAMDAAIAKAIELDTKMNVAICDAGGNLLMFERMDDAMLVSSSIAIDKAWTAAFGKMSTQDFFDVVNSEDELRLSFPHRPRLVLFGGGVPVKVDGQVVGAVGVSGGSAEQDAAVAQAGADAVA
ncbi:GlcG/HbpS family heme-binding protein [Propioniferax innocua]|uniref:Uncharacterized protein GlcG (DUF336 family) n=1 Tax=Propioniferax innocua TaxID=1753 RepID=A0A542ZR04_9ACTN|nr:heme-binding protein [Propioniferax innocua]TQL62757.1 uncharacterized protein GlcG (DUF336 family) [Propioniferax innocua]